MSAPIDPQIPSGLTGVDAAVRNEGASKAQQVAVIGCGYWGKNLVRNFAQIGALGTVCDLTDEGCTRAADIAPEAEILAAIEPIWLRDDLQAVVIATPAETHFDLVRRALLAGKDVFVEKPLAPTYEQGAELVSLAHQNGRILMVGHVLEYHPAIVKLLGFGKVEGTRQGPLHLL